MSRPRDRWLLESPERQRQVTTRLTRQPQTRRNGCRKDRLPCPFQNRGTQWT